MKTYTLTLNVHRFPDCSDTPRKRHVRVQGETPDEARGLYADKVRSFNPPTIGNNEYRYIGLIFDAE